MKKYLSAILAVVQYAALLVGGLQLLAILVAFLVSQNEVASSALSFQMTPAMWFWIGMKFFFGAIFIGVFYGLKHWRKKLGSASPIDSQEAI